MCTPSSCLQAENDNGPPLPLIYDALALSARIADAQPGTILAYHIGALARDRYAPLSTLAEAERVALSILADYALRLAETGWAHLLQRRLGEERFLYLLVIRARRPRASFFPLPELVGSGMQEAA
jgi:hypothetical protein